MREYSISEKFSLVALDGQNSEHHTTAKKAVVRGIVMAEFLQEMLFDTTEHTISELSGRIQQEIQRVKKMKRKERNAAEQKMVQILTAQNVLTKVPDLLGCDMNYQTASVSMWQYKCDETEYMRIVEGVRAEILESGEVSDDMVCLMYLFRECGIMHDIFSVKEQDYVEQRLVSLMMEESLYKAILETEFHSGIDGAYIGFVKKKHNLFKNPYLQGVNLLFPFLDRRQAIFIDMMILGTNVAGRREATIQFLREKGHSCEDVSLEGEHFIKIENSYYRVWPSARQCKFPIQGVELLPVYR